MGADKLSEPPDHEGLYPIRTVSSLTGVNPVTLRAWERRYGLIRPQRTPKGHRLYTEADIERIQRILELLDQGIPIGQTPRLVDARLATGEGNRSRAAGEEAWTALRQRALEAVRQFDTVALGGVYNEALGVHPLPEVQRSLVRPISRELGERSREDALSRLALRFFNAFMRTKLGAQLHHCPESGRGPRLLVAGLPAETSETELLLFTLEALSRGYRVTLLGADVPITGLAAAAERAQARALALFGEYEADTAAVDRDLADLVRACDVPVFIGGRIAEQHGGGISAGGAMPLPSDSADALSALHQGLAR